MTAPADRKCNGRTGTAGKPLLPCVQCERRVIPHGLRVALLVPPPVQFEEGSWRCDARIGYGQEQPA